MEKREETLSADTQESGVGTLRSAFETLPTSVRIAIFTVLAYGTMIGGEVAGNYLNDHYVDPPQRVATKKTDLDRFNASVPLHNYGGKVGMGISGTESAALYQKTMRGKGIAIVQAKTK